MDKEGAIEMGMPDLNDSVGSDEDESCKEVVMETAEEAEPEANSVKILFSHEGMTEHLRPIGATRRKVHTQAQVSSDGPRRKVEKMLKDVTNKLEAKPTIAKPIKPILKLSGAQQIKIL